MEGKKDGGFWARMRRSGQLEGLVVVILAFYPLRHISMGLDLWDTGYNYANFQYMGTRHMDPMWLFSTYLANAAGSLLTRLPRGDSLVGMNLYTGLFASALALAGYFFCTRVLRMPWAIAFLGEMAALSLCWCPTAVLYNYLTYVLFLASSILLYLGLTGERRGYLACAGALLGANVLVRFANLPEAAMILAVWAYDLIVWLEERREGFWRRTLQHTLWCLAGYVAALAALLGVVHIRYGIEAYAAGIGRLFAMTENAAGYRPASMVRGIIDGYVRGMYWAVRIGIIAAGGTVLFALAGWLEGLAAGGGGRSLGGRGGGVQNLRRHGASQSSGGRDGAGQKGRSAAFMVAVAVRILWGAVCLAMVGWLYYRGVFSFLYYSYDPIIYPGALFLILTILAALARIFHRRAPREEKLISGMVVLTVLLTPIGSNNGNLSSLNNLFLAAPYTLWESWRFLRYAGERRTERGLVLSPAPAKGVLAALLGLCLFQFGAFGATFAFAEATGIRNAEATVEGNPVLRGVRMSPEKAEWMGSLSVYAEEAGLGGREVILYGWIPALSYYLQMPSAFNPWSDLASYSLEAMERDMGQLEGEIREKGRERPVVILEDAYARALSEQDGGAGASGLSEEKRKKLEADPKWGLLRGFLEDFGYEQAFRNEKFAVYR